MRIHSRLSSYGFTLIELLVVIAVLGILASGLIVLVNPPKQIGRAHDAKRKSDLDQIQKALEVYYDDNNQYPATAIINGKFGGNWAPYMQVVPQDSASGQQYAYQSTGQTYQLYAHLEDNSDASICKASGVPANCPAVVAGTSCGSGKVCDYGISSSNTSP
jgi:prepilin-type N-terminal cleavage/methylation domain-containing protein